MRSFADFAERKTREADAAALRPLVTAEDRSSAFEGLHVGNEWSQAHYDGLFHLPLRNTSTVPIVSLVFVQSREGNTAADNPEDLGGGPVDKHVIYEGLSRVAADAVLAGAKSVGQDGFFSVWRSELVALRAALGLPRHPAQVVVTGSGCVDLDRARLFNVPDVPVYILSTPGGCRALERAASSRPWVELVPIEGASLRAPLEYLRRTRGIRRISAIGGRTTATALIDEQLVDDICLTTTAKSAGKPNTPMYTGSRTPSTTLITRKRGTDPANPIVFEQSQVTTR